MADSGTVVGSVLMAVAMAEDLGHLLAVATVVDSGKEEETEDSEAGANTHPNPHTRRTACYKFPPAKTSSPTTHSRLTLPFLRSTCHQ